jgi:hypothetical protein
MWLVGRTTMLEQTQDFGLPRCQVGVRGARRGLFDVRDLPEHADDVTTAHEGNRAQVDAEPVTVGADQNDL